MKIGIYEKALNNKWTFEEKIIIAKSAGFDFIEFSIDESSIRLARLKWTQTQINEMKEILIKHNFKLNSMTLSAHRKFPFGSHDIKTRKKAIWIMRKAIFLAKELGIYNIQLAGYDVYYETSDNNTKQWFLEGVKQAVKLAEENSIMLSFETMDTIFMGTITKALKYVKQINSPWLQIYPDLGNIYQWAKDSLENEFEQGKHHIVGIHFKNTKPNVFRDVAWEAGSVDFVRLFKILKKINYVGPYLIEMWSTNSITETTKENGDKIAKAMKFFKRKLKESQ